MPAPRQVERHAARPATDVEHRPGGERGKLAPNGQIQVVGGALHVLRLESHAGLTETARASLDLCRRMQSPALGINYDAANVRFYSGQDPVVDLESCEADLADYLIHVHIKDHAGGRGDWNFPPLGEGNVDFDGLARSFRRLGYSGPYSLEIEFLGPDSTDPTPEIIDAGVAQSYEFMRRLGLGD